MSGKALSLGAAILILDHFRARHTRAKAALHEAEREVALAEADVRRAEEVAEHIRNSLAGSEGQ